MKTRFWPALALAALFGAGCASSGPTTSVQYLSGRGKDDTVTWDFYATGGRNSGAWTKIKVPSNWEQEGFGAYNYGYDVRNTPNAENAPDFAREQGRYRLDFPVPADWKDRTINLVFEGVMTDTEVKVNGQPAGPVHQGSFYRFKYDITPLLKFGQTNQLEVTVSKESANRSVNNAERRGDYWNFGGIFRPVFLEALPKQHIDWTAIDARADGSFRAQVHLGPDVAPGAKVTAQIYDAQEQPVGAPFAADVAAGQNQATLQTTAAAPKLWTAETPNLYHVRFTLSASGAAEHVVTDRFGFRTFEVRPGDGLYLNGQKIVLKGVNRHSFWPESGRALSKEICYDDVRLIKEGNMNAVRMSHYPPDHEFLDACDELGLYVLDELAGWHGSYDTPTGQKLIGEMIRRDVNHPSILFWDNGNEGGWNAANDGEFAKWDPQQRTVLHPQARLGAVNAPHYPAFQAVQQNAAGNEVFMYTEMLHALYDGGGGAGLHDFWGTLSQAPHFGGGFIWALVDESAARTDEGGKLDSRGSYAPDGIVGPHREKEGSFYTVREIWSPVQLWPAETRDGTAEFLVDNWYDFTNLKDCTFSWDLVNFPAPAQAGAGNKIVASGAVLGPDVAARKRGTLQIPVGAASRQADALLVTAKDPQGRPLWTWTTLLKEPNAVAAPASGPKVSTRVDGSQQVVQAGNLELRFDRATGLLAKVAQGGKPLSLGNGPRFVAAVRAPRGPGSGNPPTTQYTDIAGESKLTAFNAAADGSDVVVTADYDGALKQAKWRISPNGSVRLDYAYAFNGTVELMGVNFDYPEADTKAITWLGMGPYRSWQNRLEGTRLDVWHNTYNDPTPGESWVYPEFKGYFRGWRWAVLDTTEGKITITNRGDPGKSFLGIFTPRDGNVGGLLNLPQTGLAVFDVIPAMRDKGKLPPQLGPQSVPQEVSGERKGALVFDFSAR